MFPLKTGIFPATATDLAFRLNESLRDVFNLANDPVRIVEAGYPHLASLTVSLDGAHLSGEPPVVPTVGAESVPALTADSFLAKASPMFVGPASIDFALEAQHLDLHRSNDANGNVVLVLHRAIAGRLEVSVSTADLERLIAEVAKTEAAKHGVAIDQVNLSLRSNSPGLLAAEIRLRAKKMFLSTTLRITAQVHLDDKLNARISGLDCTGEGAIASVACGVLKPHLEKLEGRAFSLMSLPLGEVRLRDLRIAVSDRLSVTADFGLAEA